MLHACAGEKKSAGAAQADGVKVAAKKLEAAMAPVKKNEKIVAAKIYGEEEKAMQVAKQKAGKKSKRK